MYDEVLTAFHHAQYFNVSFHVTLNSLFCDVYPPGRVGWLTTPVITESSSACWYI